MGHNAAIIIVSNKAILDWLQFEDGEIHSVRIDTERWDGANIEFVIEHPDLPQVRDGEIMVRIIPAYSFSKHGRYQKMIRIDPPKKKK